MSHTPTAYLRLGLTGYPLGHSLSPRIHRAALAALGLAGEYQLYPVAPDMQGAAGLAALTELMKRSELHGLNVTIPHKQAIVRHLDELTDTARGIGAVNTLYLRSGLLVGDNTDGAGFIADLQRVAPHFAPPYQGRALVLGAGGSARAVVYMLLHRGWQVTLVARRLEQAQDLVSGLGKASGFAAPGVHEQIRCLDWQAPVLSTLQQVDLLVNTTPLGMAPESDASPWPAQLPLPPAAFVYDLVYNPPRTRLVSTAQAAGLAGANGLGMLVEQAARAFELWSGLDAPRPAMWEAVQEFSNKELSS